MENGGRRNWRRCSAASLAALLVVGFTACSGAGTDWSKEPRERVAAQWAAEAEEAAPRGTLALKTFFPKEFEQTNLAAADDIKAGLPTDEVDRRAYLRAQKLIGVNMGKAAYAPTPHLLAYAREELALLSRLQRDDVRLCAATGMARLPYHAEYSEAATALADAGSYVQLAAARAGIDHPVRRAAPDLADRGLLGRAMAAQGLEPELVTVALDGKVSTRSPSEQCLASIAFYRSMPQLPPEAAGRLMAVALAGGSEVHLQKAR